MYTRYDHKFDKWAELNDCLAKIGKLAPGILKCVSQAGSLQLILNGRKIGLSTFEYYGYAMADPPNWVWIMSNVMDCILLPIEKAGLLDCYREALKEFYGFGLTIFPPDFRERWKDIMQFYHDYAGALPERKKIKIEQKIQRFRQENKKKEQGED